MTSEDGIEYYKLISRARELLVVAEMMEFLPTTKLPMIIKFLDHECTNTKNLIKGYRKKEKKKERLY